MKNVQEFTWLMFKLIMIVVVVFLLIVLIILAVDIKQGHAAIEAPAGYVEVGAVNVGSFSAGKDSLTSEMFRHIAEFEAKIPISGDYRIWAIGHADCAGSNNTDRNEEMAERRAKKVVDELFRIRGKKDLPPVDYGIRVCEDKDADPNSRHVRLSLFALKTADVAGQQVAGPIEPGEIAGAVSSKLDGKFDGLPDQVASRLDSKFDVLGQGQDTAKSEIITAINGIKSGSPDELKQLIERYGQSAMIVAGIIGLTLTLIFAACILNFLWVRKTREGVKGIVDNTGGYIPVVVDFKVKICGKDVEGIFRLPRVGENEYRNIIRVHTPTSTMKNVKKDVRRDIQTLLRAGLEPNFIPPQNYLDMNIGEQVCDLIESGDIVIFKPKISPAKQWVEKFKQPASIPTPTTPPLTAPATP
jgi:hypothetical protein